MSKLDIQYKKGVYLSFDFVLYSIQLDIICFLLRAGLGRLLNNGQNPLSMMKVIYWVHSDDRLKHDRLSF